jgi:hypothetical protein
MSFIVSGYVSNNRPQGLTKAETLTQPETHLMLILASHGNDNGAGIWPSYNTIALSMKSDRRTVISWMNSLIKKKYVIKKGRSANNKSLTNQYYLNVNKLRAETCQKPQQFDDEMNPFEAEVRVIHDHHKSEPRSPQGCSTITNPVIHDHPNNPLTSLEKNNNKEAKAVVAAFVKGAEGKEGKGEAAFTPEGEALIQDMARLDITNKVAVEYLNEYGADRIKEVLEMTEAKADKNPAGYFVQALKGNWKPSKSRAVKGAPKEQDEVAARRHQEAIDERKRKEEWEARESARKALQSNPERVSNIMGALRDAIKQGRRERTA